MKNSDYTKLAAGLAAVGMSLVASGAWADVLPVQNLTFNQLTNPLTRQTRKRIFLTPCSRLAGQLARLVRAAP